MHFFLPLSAATPPLWQPFLLTAAVRSRAGFIRNVTRNVSTGLTMAPAASSSTSHSRGIEHDGNPARRRRGRAARQRHRRRRLACM